MCAVTANRFLPLAALLLPLGAGCSRPVESVAGTRSPVDFSELPGEPDWQHLPDPKDILAHSDYKPPALFPCMNCHATKPPDPTPRALTGMHSDIVFHHDEEHRWCFGCHNPDDRNKLRLAYGKLIDFADHFELCGQCHGTIYRDWRVGIHGKRTGDWNGEKRYWVCVDCHDPHNPKFKPIAPQPPPDRPLAEHVSSPISKEASTPAAVRQQVEARGAQ